MKNLYIILLLTFGFGQDYSLQFDGVVDYVNCESTQNINNFAEISQFLKFNNKKLDANLFEVTL